MSEEKKKRRTTDEWVQDITNLQFQHSDVVKLQEATIFFMTIGNKPQTALHNALGFCMSSETYDLAGVPAPEK
jgi:hypothetical protein